MMINISIIHPLLLGKKTDILGGLCFRLSRTYSWAHGGSPHQAGMCSLFCWEEAESCLAGAHHNQGVLDRVRGKYEISTRRSCWLFAKNNHGTGPGEPWTALPSLHVLCIQAPCQGCYYTHTTWGLSMVEKSFQPCKTRKIQKENRGEEGFTRVSPGRWMAHLNSRLQDWCAFNLAERKTQSMSEPGSCTKFSAHWWVMIFQHFSPWLSLAIIFIPFSQLVPCLHDRRKY